MRKILVAMMMTALVLMSFGCQNPSGSDSASNPTYSVTYNGNGSSGGTAPLDSTKYESGKTVTVLTNTFTKSASSFTGWNSKADGSGTAYAPSTTFTMPANDVALYAQWSALPTYNVIYNVNGGVNAPVDGTGYIANSNAVVVTSLPTRTDYLCIGWTLASDNSGTVLKAGDSITIGSSNVTLYAKWSPKKFSMKLYQGVIVNGLDTDGKPYTEDLYRFTLVGYGEKTSGNFVVTAYDGTVYTGTFEYVDGPVITTTISTRTETSHYKFILSNGDSVTVPFKKIMDKTTGALLRYKTDDTYVASSDAMTATIKALYGNLVPFGAALTPLEFAEF